MLYCGKEREGDDRPASLEGGAVCIIHHISMYHLQASSILVLEQEGKWGGTCCSPLFLLCSQRRNITRQDNTSLLLISLLLFFDLLIPAIGLDKHMANPKVFLDITIGGTPAGRVVIEV